MLTRRISLAAFTSGVLITVGLNSGCHLTRHLHANTTSKTNWFRPQASTVDESFGEETDNTEREISAPNPDRRFSSPSLRLPPEPEQSQLPTTEQPISPAPPATDFESTPQARWRPAQPARSATAYNYTSVSQNDQQTDLPPARVTYNSEGPIVQEPNQSTSSQPVQQAQPRLFRPAGSARSMFDTVKRKLAH